jgi:hypothetical protein
MLIARITAGNVSIQRFFARLRAEPLDKVTVTELTGWEHSLKNELILARRVHREHRPSRRELDELLAATGVRPKLVRELFPAAAIPATTRAP